MILLQVVMLLWFNPLHFGNTLLTRLQMSDNMVIKNKSYIKLNKCNDYVEMLV